mmetsp:Transcript_63846/g.208138  ORF Transcript_63846/g.208138 Transcript_63846/m.208138 type:complete len:229 (+) Transcript_63846:1097-1783(+)
MACVPPGCTASHFVTSQAWPLMTIQTSDSAVCLDTSSMVRPPPPATAPPPAAGAAAPPSLPFLTAPLPPSATKFFSMVPALWIMFHSSEASWPRYATMACSPPGWIGIHFVTSMTSPLMTIQASSFLLCFFTSSIGMPLGAAGAAGAAAAPATAPLAKRSLTLATSSSIVSCSNGFSSAAGAASLGDISPCATFAGEVMELMIKSRKSCTASPLVMPEATARPAIRPE